MTNEQLYIMFKQMVTRLREATEAADDLMPEGAPRQKVRTHVEKGCPGLMCFNEKHFSTDPIGTYIALSPVVRLVEEWEKDVEALAPAGKER